MSLAIRFGDGISAAAGAGWRDAVVRELAEAGVAVVAEKTAGSVVVRIDARIETGRGSTAAGTAFVAARAHATVQVLRASVEVSGRPAIAPDGAASDGAAVRAMTSLADRVVAALTW